MLYLKEWYKCMKWTPLSEKGMEHTAHVHSLPWTSLVAAGKPGEGSVVITLLGCPCQKETAMQGFWGPILCRLVR